MIELSVARRDAAIVLYLFTWVVPKSGHGWSRVHIAAFNMLTMNDRPICGSRGPDKRGIFVMIRPGSKKLEGATICSRCYRWNKRNPLGLHLDLPVLA